MKYVIVFGATGFIGRSLVPELRRRIGATGKVIAVSSADCDLTNQRSTFDWFERIHWMFECDQIFHLAAVYKAGGWPTTHPATQFFANMGINLFLLEGWKRYFPKSRLTSVVSYCMYPDHDQPHPESELYGTEPEPYLFAYAFTKKALLIGQRAYCQEFGLSANSVVLSTVYGPGDSFLESSHVIGALIGKFSRAVAEERNEVEVWGDGTQEREFLFVQDAVDGIIDSAENAIEPVLNLGAGESVTVRRVAEVIAEQTGFKGKIVYNTDRFVGAQRRLLDTKLAYQTLKWRPKVSLEEGIAKTIAVFRN